MIADNGTHWELTIPRNPESIGRAERHSRTILEKTRCMLQESGLGNNFWAEAVGAASYVSNRSPRGSIDMKTLYQLWEGTIPDLSSNAFLDVRQTHTYLCN